MEELLGSMRLLPYNSDFGPLGDINKLYPGALNLFSVSCSPWGHPRNPWGSLVPDLWPVFRPQIM